LISNDRENLIVFKMNILILFKNRFAVVIQFYNQAVRCFYSSNFDMILFNITSSKIFCVDIQ
jgi:hypothetical protein